jgi:hypothetical protein
LHNFRKFSKDILGWAEEFGRMAITDAELVEAIHAARFGTALKRGDDIKKKENPYFRELCVFAKNQRNAKLPAVSEPTVRNWLSTEPPTPNENGKVFLLHYVRHILRAPGLGDVKSIEALSQVQQHLVSILPDDKASDDPSKVPILDEIGIDRVRLLFNYSRYNSRPIARDLFRDGEPKQERDYSYFLLFRYSTNRGELLKSFLVVKKPDSRLSNHYAFNHFIWGGARHRHIYRECEGAVLKLEKSYYFMGYNFIVKANKRDNPARYAELRDEAKETPNGMGLIAAEYTDVESSPGLFSGVTMTLAANHQPVLARIAFLHLGTKSGLECEVSDGDVEPNELAPARLARDLRQTVKHLIDKGAKQFGTEVQAALSEGKLSQAAAGNMANQILSIIDNTPAWERTRRGSKPQARGALEPFGPGRPRD